MTARTRCGWVKFRKCIELLYGRRYLPRLKVAVYESYARPAMLYGSKAWCLNDSGMGILRRTEIHDQCNAYCATEEEKKFCRFHVHIGFE